MKESAYRVQHFGKNGQWVWTRRRLDLDTALALAKSKAAAKGVETRVWLSGLSGDSLIYYVSPDGGVERRAS
jgi:hypothetical protein